MLVGAEQVVYSGVLFSEIDAMRALRVNQNSKVAAGQLNNELKLTIKLCKAERSCRLSDNSLQVYHYEPQTHHTLTVKSAKKKRKRYSRVSET